MINNFLFYIRYLVMNLLRINKGQHISNPPAITGYWPKFKSLGKLIIGRNCEFRAYRLRIRLNVRRDATLEIGNNSFINDGVNICATQKIVIGPHAKIADNVYIYDTDFHKITHELPTRSLPVYIGYNVWIGANSTVLAGAKIGDHSVIGAGSVVTGTIPSKCVAAGNPAKVIKYINVPDDWVRE